MSQGLSQQQVRELIVESPVGIPARTIVDRSFDLPTALYVATAALYLAFIGVMAGSFLNPELAVPMVIFAGFVILAFGLVGGWIRMKPANDDAPPNWAQFHGPGLAQTESKRQAEG